ncbi:MerR family transcriptional regulator [Clostridium sp.]|uniref:MerR family transcriptional regulator n=2 Tax=Clostridium sp. TaxID=1506 RepID=UPI002FC5C39A
MLRIGDFSKLSRISVRMLRHYDEIGLLSPDHVDESSGYRYYHEDKLITANRINSLKDMGFGLKSISSILSSYSSGEDFASFLSHKAVEVYEEMEDLKKQLTLIETTLDRLKEDNNLMNYNVTLKEIPSRHVASCRSILPSYMDEGSLWQTMFSEASSPLKIDNPCYSIAIFHDKEYKESNVDVEIQMCVKGNYIDSENVKFKDVDQVLVASAMFKGSYDQIGNVNIAIANWVRDNNYKFNGPMFNIYHIGPANESNPDNFLTEVCIPVSK